MLVLKPQHHERQSSGAAGQWPSEVRSLLEVMSGGPTRMSARRTLPRFAYRVKGTIELSESHARGNIVIYTRDIHQQALGFLSATGLSVGSTGVVELPGPDGQMLSIPFSVLRCRHVSPKWHEGCLYFSEVQAAFSQQNMDTH